MNNEINNTLKKEIMKKENNIYLSYLPAGIGACGGIVGGIIGAAVGGGPIGAAIGVSIVGGAGAYAGEKLRIERDKNSKLAMDDNNTVSKKEN